MKDWINDHLADTIIGVGFVLIVASLLVVAVSDAADPVEQATTDAPGVTSVQTTEHKDGSYTTTVQRVQDVGEEAMRREDITFQYIVNEPYGSKAGCKKAIETINHKNSFGQVIVRTYHKLYFCYDGQRARVIGQDRKCEILRGSNWVADRQTLGWWSDFGGSNHGAWHDWVHCRFGSWSPTDVMHQSEIVGFSNGGVQYP